MMDIRDTFGFPKESQSPQNMTNANVIITDVVWSLPQSGLDDPSDADQSQHGRTTDQEADSFLAAAGSNGVFVIWNARHAFLEQSASTITMGYPPDAVLTHSSRAVNRLAWHPTGKYPGSLLTASQVRLLTIMVAFSMWLICLSNFYVRFDFTNNERTALSSCGPRKRQFRQKGVGSLRMCTAFDLGLECIPCSNAICQIIRTRGCVLKRSNQRAKPFEKYDGVLFTTTVR